MDVDVEVIVRCVFGRDVDVDGNDDVDVDVDVDVAVDVDVDVDADVGMDVGVDVNLRNVSSCVGVHVDLDVGY